MLLSIEHYIIHIASLEYQSHLVQVVAHLSAHELFMNSFAPLVMTMHEPTRLNTLPPPSLAHCNDRVLGYATHACMSRMILDYVPAESCYIRK